MDEKIPWASRPQFQPDFGKLEAKMIDATPVDIDNTFACTKEIGSELVGYQLTGDSLNIRLEKNNPT